MMLNGLLMPAFLFCLLICFLIYLGIGRAEGMKGKERQRITVIPEKGASDHMISLCTEEKLSLGAGG